MYDRYYPVENLPNCTEASNPKYNWQRNDPPFGLDFRVWKQLSEDPRPDGSCALEGATAFRFTESAPVKCYAYDVLVGVCALVKFNDHYMTQTYSWDFVEGCFQNGEYTQY